MVLDAVRLGSNGSVSNVDAVILRANLVQPTQLVLHKGRAKADRVPTLKICADPACLGCKFFLRRIELPVVLQAVYADLEALLFQHAPQFVRNRVAPFRNEVEARAKAVLLLHIHDGPNPVDPSLTLDVVRQNHGELLAGGPSRPSRRCRAGSRIDGPHVGVQRASAFCAQTSNTGADGPRQVRFQNVVNRIDQHRLTDDSYAPLTDVPIN